MISSSRYSRLMIATVLFMSLSFTTGTAFSSDADTVITISGEIDHPVVITKAEWPKLPRQKVRAKDHGGDEYDFRGVPVFEILKLAGVTFGENVRGKVFASSYLVVEAADGFKTLFAFPELDTSFNTNTVILADQRDNQPLPNSDGPLRMIVPHEKRHARWIRQVVSLIIRRL